VARTVVLVGALDTKGEDFAFVRERLQKHGCRVLLVDTGVLGQPTTPADIGREAVAEAAGVSLAALVATHDRGAALSAMARGAAAIVRKLHDEKRIDGIMGMGGGSGTSVAAAAMRGLPIGFPKLLVSTGASGDTRSFVGNSDMVLVPSVVDVAGLNRISRTIYARAADALSGMVRGVGDAIGGGGRPLIAATMFGNTTPCVSRARQRLEELGYEVLVFHANGGGRAMEQLIDDGLVDAVLDLTTTELADELVGGVRSAGPHRLEAAARRGIPQVVSVGALDMVNFGGPETIPARLAGRHFRTHTSLAQLMRTDAAESAELGRILAEKLNAATGPVALLLPLRGISALDAPGEPFDDPVARTALFDALRTGVDRSKVEVFEVDANINDPEFADHAVDVLLGLLPTVAQHVGTPATN